MTRPPRWPVPRPGDIVGYRFPEDLAVQPGTKPRPALVTAVGTLDGELAVKIAYGTSRKTDRLFAGEFLIGPADVDAYLTAGPSYLTKFNLAKQIELPLSQNWFAVAPGAPFGQTPKLGILHPSLMSRARSAFEGRRR